MNPKQDTISRRDDSTFATTRLSRRRLLRHVVVGAAGVGAVSLLAACGDDDDTPAPAASPTTDSGAAQATPTSRSTAAGMVLTPSPQAADSTPTSGSTAPEPTATTAPETDEARDGGVWTMALHGDPSFNLVTQAGALLDILVWKTMFNNLVQYELVEGSIAIVPDLAVAWEATEDLLEYTFTLNPDAIWHDGTPVTAGDVVFTIETVINPDNNAAGRANVSSIASAAATDDHTVVFTLNQPFAALPVMLGYNRVIFPKHLWEGLDFANPGDYLRNPVGTGPFKFVEQVQGSHVELERFDDFFGGRPHLDTLIFKVIPDGNSRVAQVVSGDVDFAVIDPPQISAVEGNDKVEIRLAPQVNYYFFAINHSNPHLQDVRVRQALAHAIDRDAIIDNILQGTGEPAIGPINPLLGAYFNPDVVSYEYDPDRAAALLEEAGWTKGDNGLLVNEAGETFTLRFNGPSPYPIMVQVITYAQQQYKNLGFDVTLEIVDWPVHLDMYGKQEYDLLMQWWITPPDPDLYPHYSSEVNNRWKYSNATADELMAATRAEPDVEQRIALFHELQELLAEDVPVVYLYYPQEVQAVSTRSKGLPLIGYRDMLTWMEQAWVED